MPQGDPMMPTPHGDPDNGPPLPPSLGSQLGMGVWRAGSEVKGASHKAAGVHLSWGPAIISGTGRVPPPLSLELAPWLGSGVLSSSKWQPDPSSGGEKTTFQSLCLSQLTSGCLRSLPSLGRDNPAWGQNVRSREAFHCWSEWESQPPGTTRSMVPPPKDEEFESITSGRHHLQHPTDSSLLHLN